MADLNSNSRFKSLKMMKKIFLILTSISKTIAVTDYGDIDFDLDFYGNAIKID